MRSSHQNIASSSGNPELLERVLGSSSEDSQPTRSGGRPRVGPVASTRPRAATLSALNFPIRLGAMKTLILTVGMRLSRGRPSRRRAWAISESSSRPDLVHVCEHGRSTFSHRPAPESDRGSLAFSAGVDGRHRNHTNTSDVTPVEISVLHRSE